MQQHQRHTARTVMPGSPEAGQGQLDRGVGAIVGLEEIDVFGQIATQLGC
jgi:hypothetical protein